MKNIIIILLGVIVIVLASIIVCRYKNQENYSKDIVNNVNSVDTPNSQEFYSKYEITDVDNTFDKIIRNNSIDKNLKKGIQKVSTTIEFIEIYNSYTSIWKTELNKTLEILKEYLNGEEKLKLNEIQEEWENLNEKKFQFEYDAIKNEEHNILAGSSFNWLYEKAVMESYRQRTIDIKYLAYCLTHNSRDEIKLNMEF